MSERGVPRRRLLRLIAGGALVGAVGLPSRSAERVRRIGYLGNVPLGNPGGSLGLWAAFVAALKERGYVEGTNIAFELRYVQGQLERVPALVAELVRIPVDVIVVGSGPGVRAAKEATSTIPIVMIGVSDPVGAGLVASMNRPGGNVTGMADLQIDLIPKRLELLKTVVPTVRRVAFVRANYSGFGAARAEAEQRTRAAAAEKLGIALLDVPMMTPQDFDTAMATVRKERADALLVSPNPTNFIKRRELAAFALDQRLPAVAARREEVEAGILMAYGPSVREIFRTAGGYVAQVLDGIKPADLPVQQPSKIELVVNGATARALGLALPKSLQVDDLI